MYSHQTIESEIKNAVSSGELPTTVFRRILSQYPDVHHSMLGSHFRVAFPKVDGAVWNMVVHWRPSTLSEPHDMRVNIGLIHELIQAGYEVPWDAAWPESQWQRIKEIVAPSTRSQA